MSLVSNRYRPSWTTMSMILLTISLLTKMAAMVWLSYHLPQEATREYSYVGDDYPIAWPIKRTPVIMASDNSAHFRLNTTDGIAEWSAIIPGGDGIVRLGPSGQPYTISMLHQLRCLGILREEFMRGRTEDSPTALGRHCLNYIRQMVMCRGDIQLEPFQYASHKDPIDLYNLYQCKDWGAVYDAVLENQRSWKNK